MMIDIKRLEVAKEQMRWNCPEDAFQFETTKDLEHLDRIIGQERAVEAIRMGTGLRAKGYNIFVTGLSGTGRLSTVKQILETTTTEKPKLYDYCYVNNFSDPDKPILVKLPRSKGKEFKGAIGDAISYLKRRIPKLFEEDSYQQSRRKIVEEYQEKERSILSEFDKKIKPHGFIRGQIETEQGIVQPEVFPIIDNKPVQIETLDDLVEEGKLSYDKANQLKELWKKFHSEIFELAKSGMKLMKEFKRSLTKNDKASAEIVVTSVFSEVADMFHNDRVDIYIDEVINHILNNLTPFVQGDSSTQNPQEVEKNKEAYFNIYEVNVVLDNSDTEKAPLVIETTPSYQNLFGTIEKVFDSRGFWRTDFTKIKAGALLRADQGFLIVNAVDLFQEQGVWPALKRVLLYGKLEIQTMDAYFQISQSYLKPEAINVNVKVVIIGGQTLYQQLYHFEKGFKKIFKINAQFDYETKNDDNMLDNLARFISKLCDEENLPHCKPDGVAAIAEWAVEKAGSQDRMTLKFSDIADVVREAAFYDKLEQSPFIGREDVDIALNMRRKRNDMIDSKIKNHILEGSTMIDTEGNRVGQINGLTVYDNGILSFGKPARITASISAGNKGVVNVEREADMSGRIHNKGILIISAFLRERFAKKKPMSLTASLAFEQSYGGIDGDSASAAEIYVILSELTNTPINQSIAITGSVNQKGDIQPIGGVNEKVRGFFEICKEKGFNGQQGCIIPKQNVKDLMMCKELLDAVDEGNFKIWYIEKIEDGIPILMGIEAGEADKNGKYPKNTLFGKALEQINLMREWSKDEKSDNKKKSKSTKKEIE